MPTAAHGPSDDIGTLVDRTEAVARERPEETSDLMGQLEQQALTVSGSATSLWTESSALGTIVRSAVKDPGERAITWLPVGDVLRLGSSPKNPKLSRGFQVALERERAAISGSTFTGRTRKLSVSLPEDLVEEVRERIGEREFSRYVAEAVSRQIELDKLAELADELSAEFGSIPEESLAKARAVWPDANEQ